MRKIFTAEDVDNAASKGEHSITIAAEDTITAMALERAEALGIQFELSGAESRSDETRYGTSMRGGGERPSSGKVVETPYRGLLTEREVDVWRKEFPILKDVIHVANCSQSAQAKRVRGAIERYLDNWLSVGMDWNNWVNEVGLAKAEFAKLIGADASEICVTSSVSEAVSSVASALDYSGQRKKIVVTDAEFPTVDHVWLAQQKYGVKVDFISTNQRHEVDLSEYDRYIDETTLLASITQVYYLNGFKQDIAKIAETAHRKGALALVDAYQGLGTEPVDVKSMNIDMLTSGNLKYLFGIPGIAFLYVDKRLVPSMKPAVTGWFGQSNPFLFQTRYLDWAPEARRLDTGTPPVLNAYAARAGLEIANEIGVARIKDRIDMLSAYALRGVLARGLTCWSPFDVNKKGGTTAIYVGDKMDSHHMETALRKRNIIASARGEVIRVAPHFYTKPNELDVVLDAIKEILDGEGHKK
ncbi:MAG: aminotransferase class V-fold PLP-dependent enzyme [Synergistaceae bacterium]|jgi:selenocysteine lyase/cysteine desulfurase|nr:aminotransferase class V-fold PLP-dependent enzyme [Synergistaceae bacterium]